ncbi:MAG: nuclear transport factor 2 family protein [Candidatus Sulfotelmatobacter sp.]|jgi:hypothetical protein
MKLHWLSQALIFCLLGSGPLVAQSSGPIRIPTALEQTAMSNEKSLIEAKKKDDATFFKRKLAEDFSLVGIDGQLLQGEEATGGLGDADLVELTPYNMKVAALDDNGAVVTYDAIVREAPQEDQGPPPRYQHFSSVWIEQGGQWKLKFHQTTAMHWGDW